MSIATIQEFFPFMDWLPFINSLLPPGLTVNETEIVEVTVPSFFANLGDILQATPKRTIANYLMWRVVYYASDYMTNAQRQRNLEFLTTLTGQQMEEPRWKECIKFTSSR